MGVDTKGCVVTRSKDVMLFSLLAERAISKILRQAREELFPGVRGWPKVVQEQFRSPTLELRPDTDMVLLNFRCFGEDRSIHMFFTCDCDHTDLGPNSISLSMGCWGLSELYAQSILHAWSLMGAAYFDANDSDSIDMGPLEAESITLLQAMSLDYVSAHQAESIAAQFISKQLPLDLTFKQFVGVTQKTWEKLTAIADHSERWDAMRAEACKLYPAVPATSLLSLVAPADVLTA